MDLGIIIKICEAIALFCYSLYSRGFFSRMQKNNKKNRVCEAPAAALKAACAGKNYSFMLR